MTIFPKSNILPIEYLAACFGNVTNSYKFYWLLAILDHIRENQSQTIQINDLLARMISAVWYPTNYFRLSFGKQDRLGYLAMKVGVQSKLPFDAKKREVIQATNEFLAGDSSFSQEIKSLGQYVPYRFLRTFFAQQLRGLDDWKINDRIENLANNNFFNSQYPCIYKFGPKPNTIIEIQQDWFEYLNRNLSILIGFCFWNLVNYVQKNNPNVPNVSNKLLEPEKRDLKQARNFWMLVFDNLSELSCIYSGLPMQKDLFSLDHFLPWRFVTHDLLWNIIPTPKKVNSTKSDYLPNLDFYFDPFSQLQYKAIQVVVASEKNNLLEDYALLFGIGSPNELKGISFEIFHDKLYKTIAPQFQIANNMGFTGQWRYD